MATQPRYENGVPLCQASCPHYEGEDRYSVQFSATCKLENCVTEPSLICGPAVVQMAAALARLSAKPSLPQTKD